MSYRSAGGMHTRKYSDTNYDTMGYTIVLRVLSVKQPGKANFLKLDDIVRTPRAEFSILLKPIH